MCLQVAPLDRHSGVLRELAHGWAALPGSAAFLFEMIGCISTRAQIERRGAFGGLYESNVGRILRSGSILPISDPSFPTTTVGELHTHGRSPGIRRKHSPKTPPRQ
jgi:hypothetical protein